MTGRLNKKLVIILCTCVLVLAAGLGGGWYVATRARAAAAFREAEAAMEVGDYELAIKRYAKAARHRKYSQNVELMLKASEAHRQLQVSDTREAWKNLNFMIQWLRMAVRANPHHDRALQRRMDIAMRIGRELRAASIWDGIYQETQELLRDYPDLPLAIKYRGISQVQRMLQASTNLTEDDRSQAGLDLGTTQERFGDDLEAIEHLAIWHWFEAQTLEGPGGNAEEVSRHRSEALSLTTAALKVHADDPKRLVIHLANLLRLDETDLARPHLATLERLLSQRSVGSRTATLAVGLILKFREKAGNRRGQMTRREVVQKCATLLQGVMEEHPESATLKLALARVHHHLKEREESMALFEQIWKSQTPRSPFEFVKQHSAWAEAGLSYLKFALAKVGTEKDRAQREEKLTDIEQRLAQIRGEVGDIAAVNDLAGRISAARGNWIKASMEFDQLSDRLGGAHVQTLLRAAASRMKLGEWGAAAESYRQALRLQPNLVRVRKKLARLYLAGRKYEDAKEQIDALLEADPDDTVVHRLQIEYLLRKKRFNEADSLLQQLDLANRPDDIILFGRMYVHAGRTDFARDLIARSYRRDPRHMATLFSLITLTPDQSAKLALIEQSREAGAVAENLDVITQFVEGDLDPREDLTQRRRDALQRINKPLTETTEAYRRLVSEGDRAGAEEILSQLDDESGIYLLVIKNLFRRALADKDWPTAEAMAARARDALGGLGADMANGSFYLGRLEMARGKFDQAVSHYRAGLERRRTYSHGWRMLGDALVQVKELESAIAAYETAVNQRPDSLPVLLNLATAYDRRGQAPEALRVLRQAHRYAPNDYKIANTYFDYEMNHGDAERALALRRKVLDEQPDNLHNRRAMIATLAHMRRKLVAMRELKKLLDETGTTTANQVVASQVIALAYGPSTAAGGLIRHIQDTSEQVTSEDYIRVARQLMKLGSEEHAFSAYRQAIRTEDPKTRPATRELAGLLVNREDGAGEATLLYKQLLEAFPTDAQIARFNIIALLRTNQPDDAAKALEQLVASHGMDLSALILTAQLHAQQGDLDQALEDCDKAIEQAPRRATFYVTKATLVATDTQRYGEALSIVDRALELDPLHAGARHLRSRIYRGQGDMDAAIREYEQLLDHAPRLVSARLELAQLYGATNRSRQLKSLLAASAKLYPSSPIWPQRQASAAMQDDDIDEALEKLRVTFELQPKSKSLYALVALQIKADKPADALQTLDANGPLVEPESRLQAQRGRALWMLDHKKDATSAFVTALRLAKGVRSLQTTRDQIVNVLGRSPTAKLMMTAFGAQPPMMVQIAVADLLVRDKKHDVAITRLTALEPRIEEHPIEIQLHFHQTLATALHNAGHSERAEAAYLRLLDLRPNNPSALNNLAFLQVKQLDKASEAAATAERALRLWPNNPLIMDTLGWSLYKSGEVDRGRRLLEACYERYPSAGVSLHLAEVLAHQGLTPDAINILKAGKLQAEKSKDVATLKMITEKLDQLGG